MYWERLKKTWNKFKKVMKHDNRLNVFMSIKDPYQSRTERGGEN